jgi:hypothetical protein
MEGERREAAATDIGEDSGGAARRRKGGGSPAQKRMEASSLSLSLSLSGCDLDGLPAGREKGREHDGGIGK